MLLCVLYISNMWAHLFWEETLRPGMVTGLIHIRNELPLCHNSSTPTSSPSHSCSQRYLCAIRHTSSPHVASALNQFSHRGRFCLLLMISNTLVLSALQLWDNAGWLRDTEMEIRFTYWTGRWQQKVSEIIHAIRSWVWRWWFSPWRTLVNMKFTCDHKDGVNSSHFLL